MLAGMEDTNTLVVGRGSTFTLRYTMKKPCNIRWRFKTEGLTLQSILPSCVAAVAVGGSPKSLVFISFAATLTIANFARIHRDPHFILELKLLK